MRHNEGRSRRFSGTASAREAEMSRAEVSRRGGKRFSAGLLAGTLCLLAQTAPPRLSRDAYRTAYKSWREMDQNLERDAGAAGEALGPRTAKAAEAAAAYSVERSIFLRS